MILKFCEKYPLVVPENMSYQGCYDLVVGQQLALQNIQAENFIQSQHQPAGHLLYPGLQSLSNGVAPSLIQNTNHIQSLLRNQRSSIANFTPSNPASSLQPQSKKFRAPQKSPKYVPKPIPLELGSLKTYSNPDILICGNCRELFDDIVDMLDHKKHYCKMRFTCKCEQREDMCSEGECGMTAASSIPLLTGMICI